NRVQTVAVVQWVAKVDGGRWCGELRLNLPSSRSRLLRMKEERVYARDLDHLWSQGN
ncbi:hypothetical protein A2U01_0095118, partial [Trifolium medium]|nr:hypothetical protein [Trifolium medium]